MTAPVQPENECSSLYCDNGIHVIRLRAECLPLSLPHTRWSLCVSRSLSISLSRRRRRRRPPPQQCTSSSLSPFLPSSAFLARNPHRIYRQAISCACLSVPACAASASAPLSLPLSLSVCLGVRLPPVIGFALLSPLFSPFLPFSDSIHPNSSCPRLLLLQPSITFRDSLCYNCISCVTFQKHADSCIRSIDLMIAFSRSLTHAVTVKVVVSNCLSLSLSARDSLRLWHGSSISVGRRQYFQSSAGDHCTHAGRRIQRIRNLR